MSWQLGRLRQASFVVLMAAVALAVSGCGSQPAGNTAQKFRPVDDAAASGAARTNTPTAPATSAAATADPTPPPHAGTKTAPDSAQTAKGSSAKGGGATSGAAASTSPASATADESDPLLASPAGPQLRKLRTAMTEPEGRTQQQKLNHFMRQIEDRMQVADEILAMEDAPEAAKIEALEAKIESYSVLMQIGQKDAREGLAETAQALAAVSDPAKAALGKVQLFTLQILKIAETQPRDGKQVLQAIETLLTEAGDYPQVFDAAAQAAQIMQQMRFTEDAAAAFELVGNHFAQSSNPKLVRDGVMLQVQGAILELREGDDQQQAVDALFAKAQQLADLSDADEVAAQSLMTIAVRVETEVSPELSTRFYELLAKEFAGSDSKTAEQVRSVVEAAGKRVALLGKPIAIEGTTSAGEPINWGDYEGKVVMIDFWATWCPPCMQEMPNIKDVYEKLHDQGFEVVGVNFDSDDMLKQFLEFRPLPWTTLVTPDIQEGDPDGLLKNPLAVKFGVEYLPFIVLVGRDGKVAALNTRGADLQPTVERLLAAKPTGENEPVAPAEENARRGESSQSLPVVR